MEVWKVTRSVFSRYSPFRDSMVQGTEAEVKAAFPSEDGYYHEKVEIPTVIDLQREFLNDAQKMLEREVRGVTYETSSDSRD